MQSRVLSLNRRLKVFSAHVIESVPYSGGAENKDFFMGKVANVDLASIREATDYHNIYNTSIWNWRKGKTMAHGSI